MTITEAARYFGNQYKLAKALGISRSRVSIYAQNGHIPLTRQYQLELITEGDLKADTPEEYFNKITTTEHNASAAQHLKREAK